jgi:hypothetical protein
MTFQPRLAAMYRPLEMAIWLTFFAVSVSAPGMAAPSVAPHSAVYRLSLGDISGRGAVADANGRIDFKWIEGCDGWTVDQRTHLVLTNRQGQDVESGWVLNAWESKDGLSYRFSLKRAYADGSPEETRGKARLDGPGLGGIVTFSEPVRDPVVLPAGTVFPTRYTEELLKAGEQGEVIFWRYVFDGAGEESFFGVNAAISRTIPAEAAPSFDSPLIRDQASWRMRLAYFGGDNQAAEPEHEQAQRMYASGIVDELSFEYGGFVLKASLEKLEALPPPDCP